MLDQGLANVGSIEEPCLDICLDNFFWFIPIVIYFFLFSIGWDSEK